MSASGGTPCTTQARPACAPTRAASASAAAASWKATKELLAVEAAAHERESTISHVDAASGKLAHAG